MLFPELEDLVGNLVVGFFAIGFFEKLFLESLQSFIDTISGILLSTTDHLCNVLLVSSSKAATIFSGIFSPQARSTT